MDDIKTSFNKLQIEINSKLNECSNCMETVEKLHRKAKETSIDLEEQMVNALKEEKEWIDIKTKLAKLSKKGMVILNVGGEKYTTSVDTLTGVRHFLYDALFGTMETRNR
jgi:uncharacterized protein related to proFAR isomerase